MSVVLGIDPGSRYAGFGVIRLSANGSIEHISHGVISLSPRLSFPEKLDQLAEEVDRLLRTHKPEFVVVEDIFVGKNVQSAFTLGHVRGVCFQLAARNSCKVVEYAARKVKKSVTGKGSAEKDHVRLIVLNLLGIQSDQMNDATDALALCICHVRAWESEQLIKRQLEGF